MLRWLNDSPTYKDDSEPALFHLHRIQQFSVKSFPSTRCAWNPELHASFSQASDVKSLHQRTALRGISRNLEIPKAIAKPKEEM